ncbi:hypothetical protein ACQ33O_10845 [Ferruginibacter sp. SUN002]|uniref:hypothetical protein n=1 Tax=Ferruginibacter sp. SUN002 TaxID=2937789 RepID=UPI003D35AF21
MKKTILLLSCIVLYFVSFGQSYKSELKKLNAYLKVFNPETYRDIEVKDSMVNFKFQYYTQIYTSSISIRDLKQNTTVLKGSTLGEDEIKIKCKGENKCFYSNFSNDYTDHFRFFSSTVKDLTEIERLVNKFVKSLK